MSSGTPPSSEKNTGIAGEGPGNCAETPASHEPAGSTSSASSHSTGVGSASRNSAISRGGGAE